jgi:hypothetical protein
VKLRCEFALGEFGEGRQLAGEDVPGWLSVGVGTTAVGAGGEPGLVLVGTAESEDGAVASTGCRTEKDGVHPAGDGLIMPRVFPLGAGEKLQGAFVFVIEEDTAGAGEVGGEVVGALVVEGRACCGLENVVAFHHRLVAGGVGKGGGVLF